jgi:hypothetical protein
VLLCQIIQNNPSHQLFRRFPPDVGNGLPGLRCVLTYYMLLTSCFGGFCLMFAWGCGAYCGAWKPGSWYRFMVFSAANPEFLELREVSRLAVMTDFLELREVSSFCFELVCAAVLTEFFLLEYELSTPSRTVFC